MNRKNQDSQMMINRQRREANLHAENNAFVKRSQAELAKLGGKEPRPTNSMYGMGTAMVNNAESAEELVKKLTKGMDKVAFPIK